MFNNTTERRRVWKARSVQKSNNDKIIVFPVSKEAEKAGYTSHQLNVIASSVLIQWKEVFSKQQQMINGNRICYLKWTTLVVVVRDLELKERRRGTWLRRKKDHNRTGSRRKKKWQFSNWRQCFVCAWWRSKLTPDLRAKVSLQVVEVDCAVSKCRSPEEFVWHHHQGQKSVSCRCCIFRYQEKQKSSRFRFC